MDRPEQLFPGAAWEQDGDDSWVVRFGLWVTGRITRGWDDGRYHVRLGHCCDCGEQSFDDLGPALEWLRGRARTQMGAFINAIVGTQYGLSAEGKD